MNKPSLIAVYLFVSGSSFLSIIVNMGRKIPFPTAIIMTGYIGFRKFPSFKKARSKNFDAFSFIIAIF